MNVFFAQSIVMIVVQLAILSVTIFAFVNSLLYSAEAYEAAGKLTKTTWCTILGLGVVLFFVPIPLALISIVMLVAALVYLADVRPALAGLHRR
ncbi:DUF2516 family protein [Nocardioides rubriscoriae]|uniref:DUF2516 family protein n=1 Tax=Nocardioides rubriscoriae TaxID=642762 RepID=UPI0011DF061C|nr:DUF2516 family protein [Nocardioides rubriscoriae]